MVSLTNNPTPDTPPSSEPVTDKPQIRPGLKDDFSDNRMPTGDNFAGWIDANLVLREDNVYISDDHCRIGIGAPTPNATLDIWSPVGEMALNVNIENEPMLTLDGQKHLQICATTTFKKAVEMEDRLDVKGDNTQVCITYDGDPVIAAEQFAEDITDHKAYGGFSLPYKSGTPLPVFKVTNSHNNYGMVPAFHVDSCNNVAINKERAEATLDVNGEMYVSGESKIGGALFAENRLLISGTGAKGPLLDITQPENHREALIHVVHEYEIHGEHSHNTQLLLDADGRLSLGLAEAGALFHIYRHNDDTLPLLRIDDNTQDVSPFIIDSEGKVGIGDDAPVNKLDVRGNVRIGRGYDDDQVPENSLVVQNSIGVNKLRPDAHIDIESDRNIAVHVGQDEKTLLRVTEEKVETDCNLHVKGNAAIDGDTRVGENLNVAGNSKVDGTSIVAGDTALNSNLDVAGNTQIGGDTLLAGQLDVAGAANMQQTLDLYGKATFKNELELSGTATLHSNVQIDRDLNVDGNANVQANAAVHGTLHSDGDFSTSGSAHIVGATQIDSDATIDGNLQVKGQSELQQAVDARNSLGVHLQPNTKHDASLHLGQRDSDGADVKIDYYSDHAETSFVVKNGKLGVHKDEPEHTLDVVGQVHIDGELGVNQFLRVDASQLHINEDISLDKEGYKHSTVLIERVVSEEKTETTLALTGGKLGLGTANPDAHLQVTGDAHIGDKLIVDGDACLNANVAIDGNTMMDGKLKVRQFTRLKADAQVDGQLQVALDKKEDSSKTNPNEKQANVHIGQRKEGETALRVERHCEENEEGEITESAPSLLVRDGKVGINTARPEKALDVHGQARISGNAYLKSELHVDRNTHLDQSLWVSDQVAVNVSEPEARVHIAEQKHDNAALRVDSSCDENPSSMVFKAGQLGVNTENPTTTLDVRGDAYIEDELKVKGRTILEHTLDVDKDTLLKSDLTVHQESELQRHVSIGLSKQIVDCEPQKAQLYIADTQYSEALRIETVEGKSKRVVVVKRGQLGIGKDSPDAALDVAGDARVSDNLYVGGDLKAREKATFLDNVDVSGTLTVDQRAEFGSDTRVKGYLNVEDKLTLEDQLCVEGDSELQKTTIKRDAYVLGDATIEGKTALKHQVHIDGLLGAGTDVPHAQLHVSAKEDQHPLIVENKHVNGSKGVLLKVDQNGNMGVGTASPQGRLDVNGNAIVNGSLEVRHNVKADGDVHAQKLKASECLQVNEGPLINAFSTDSRLGDSQASDNKIPTQLAVKNYVDSATSAFGSLGQAITISSQDDFDYLFNQGPGTRLPENSTIILLPLKDSYDSGSAAPAYILKNSVLVNSGTSIIGYNHKTTVIAKQEASCRFELIGNPNQHITDVEFRGWTFDGLSLAGYNHGGAFHLENVEYSKLNCHIVNHHVYGDGGAIFAKQSHHIEALHVLGCKAMSDANSKHSAKAEGGAAYGLVHSTIHAIGCSAFSGGAVAQCHQCEVIAKACSADHSGGAAFRCQQLSMTATECSAGKRGGGACFCSDLMANGFWMHNTASEGMHIYASCNLTGDHQERHYWKGDFIGRRIDNDTRVWRADNE